MRGEEFGWTEARAADHPASSRLKASPYSSDLTVSPPVATPSAAAMTA